MGFKDMRRSLIVSADMQAYSRMHVKAQYRAQHEFNRIMNESAARAGLDHTQWTVQKSGDGRLAILPSTGLEAAVVGPMAHHMDELLRAVNRDLVPDARIRVRMAIHEGIVHRGDNGYPSDAINKMSHMRDHSAVKTALSSFPDAGLVLVVTDRIYEDIVEQEYDGIRRDRFRRLVFPLKHGREAVGWVSVLNEDVNRVRLPQPEPLATVESPQRADVPVPDGGPIAPEPRRTTAEGSVFHFGEVHSTGAMSFGTDSTANSYRGGGQ